MVELPQDPWLKFTHLFSELRQHKYSTHHYIHSNKCPHCFKLEEQVNVAINNWRASY